MGVQSFNIFGDMFSEGFYSAWVVSCVGIVSN
jgi:hypothetical protein